MTTNNGKAKRALVRVLTDHGVSVRTAARTVNAVFDLIIHALCDQEATYSAPSIKGRNNSRRWECHSEVKSATVSNYRIKRRWQASGYICAPGRITADGLFNPVPLPPSISATSTTPTNSSGQRDPPSVKSKPALSSMIVPQESAKALILPAKALHPPDSVQKPPEHPTTADNPLFAAPLLEPTNSPISDAGPPILDAARPPACSFQARLDSITNALNEKEIEQLIIQLIGTYSSDMVPKLECHIQPDRRRPGALLDRLTAIYFGPWPIISFKALQRAVNTYHKI